MRFSKPVWPRLENGILFGSAQTRKSRVCAFSPAQITSDNKSSTHLRESEYIKHASLVRVMGKISHRSCESQSRGFIASVQTAGHDRPGPTAHTGQNGDILF